MNMRVWGLLVCAALCIGATPRRSHHPVRQPVAAEAIEQAQFGQGQKDNAALIVKAEVSLDRSGFSPGVDRRSQRRQLQKSLGCASAPERAGSNRQARRRHLKCPCRDIERPEWCTVGRWWISSADADAKWRLPANLLQAKASRTSYSARPFRLRLLLKRKTPVHSTKWRPNISSGISPLDHRPASKGKKRSNRKRRPTLARAAADITPSAKPRSNTSLRQPNTCRSYLVRPSPITTSAAFRVSMTATWEQLTASRPSFAPSLSIAIHRQSRSRCRSNRNFTVVTKRAARRS